MLNSPLLPTPMLTDNLFDLTAEQLKILAQSDHFRNIFDIVFGTEFDSPFSEGRGSANAQRSAGMERLLLGQTLHYHQRDIVAALQSQWQAGDLRQISELELINSIVVGKVDQGELLSAFVREQSVTDQNFANTNSESDPSNISIDNQAIVAKVPTPPGLAFNLSFDDPAGKYTPYYAAIQSSIVAAGLNWNKYIKGTGSLEIAVKFSLSGGAVATGRSLATSLIRDNGTLGIYETGALSELRTGTDPNGVSPDIEFNIDPQDLSVLWFDPTPLARTTPVPTNKIDAVSLFLHEFGHAIVFNGWKSDTDGTLPGNYQSTFDEKLSFDGTNFFFTGTRATAVYGAPVPLTFGNITHLGNDAPRPGSDLSLDLMNPYVADYGTRVGISPLDLAILADTGVSINSLRNDFNNDQKADILWRNNDGRVALWQMNGSTISTNSTFATVSTDWKISSTGDFNGDRKADILWHHNDGQVALWTMNGSTQISNTSIAKVSTDWKIVGTSDFNGDQQSDILWRNDDGSVNIWLMDGATQAATGTVGKVSTDWKIAGTGDFNGDTKSDILWRNDDGSVVLWQMNGLNLLSKSNLNPYPVVDNSWKITGIGDFNGDTKSDILWRNDNGSVDIWLMNGSNVLSTSFVSSVENSSKISVTGDFNGDGNDDILWRNNDGSTNLWEMNGANVLAAGLINSAPSMSADWKVATPIL
jgi:FG-GAP-like repeat